MLKTSEVLNISLASKSSFICLMLFHTQINMNLTMVIPGIKNDLHIRFDKKLTFGVPHNSSLRFKTRLESQDTSI